MIRGVNHVTLTVADLDRSLAFYADLLGMRVAMRSPRSAYLEAGSLWLCLQVGEPTPAARGDYNHLAFDVTASDFTSLATKVAAAAPIWQENVSEGPSLYMSDPDGHRLELHVGTLASRLAHYRDQQPAGMWIAAD